ncbi:RRQRL motif-containing zinc-binding protein [Streptomyces sp. WAC01526]|uniref:RRQRL motif-containing zinc-binding protein n=1 Tax=Streptomyces sp. WAC01526 TaxID=2588709 RepID=UPI0011DF8DC6|nr:RRQRL motif-containing zinc-binding protein [Streptomyces sp. WAC01526]
MLAARFWDPHGTKFGVPTYPWRLAPDGLATRAQLRAAGLRPGGQEIAAQILWRSRRARGGIRAAYLYRVDLAKTVRPMTPAKWAAVDAALAARRLCPACGLDRGYIIPTSLGVCVTCADAPSLAA